MESHDSQTTGTRSVPYAGHAFLSAQWRHLLMLNFEVDADVLRPFVPRGTELDDYRGRHYVSIVGFRFLDLAAWRIPVWGYRQFDEVNLRFYVRREVGGELRRGVVFLREIAPPRLIAWVAGWFYNEHYLTLPMTHHIELGDGQPIAGQPTDGQPTDGARVEYRWRVGPRWNVASAVALGSPTLPRPGSLEQFIVEHYWGYTRQRDGGTLEYRVEHPPWKLWRVREPILDCDAATLYGPRFAEPLSAAPCSALVADGSPVTVIRGVRI